jgi:hypothetical protein
MCLPRARCSRSDRVAPTTGSTRRWVSWAITVTGAAVLSVVMAACPAQAAARYASGHTPAAGARLATVASGANPYTFVGMTSQFPCQRDTEDRFCGTLNIFMAKNMTPVKRLLIGFEASCNAPDMYFGATGSYSGMTAKRSRHNTTAAFRSQESSDQQLDGGLTAHETTSLSGKVTYGRTGSGSFQSTINISDQSGRQVDTCATGALTYRVQALKRA